MALLSGGRWPSCAFPPHPQPACWPQQRWERCAIPLCSCSFLSSTSSWAPTLGIGAEASASLSLGLFEGCYMAEIFRAGIVSLPRAQWEAAYSLGFGMGSTLRLVILPQALRRVVAPLSGQIISLIKDSSLGQRHCRGRSDPARQGSHRGKLSEL